MALLSMKFQTLPEVASSANNPSKSSFVALVFGKIFENTTSIIRAQIVFRVTVCTANLIGHG